MGLGIMLPIITSGIDISVGSVLAMSGCIVAKLAVAGVNPVLCMLVGLLVGFAAGAVNGLLISKMKLQPFIATMGTHSAVLLTLSRRAIRYLAFRIPTGIC